MLGFGAQREDVDRFEELRLSHPKLYNYGMEQLGLREVIEYIHLHAPRTKFDCGETMPLDAFV
jgi:hypothetical protein